MKSISKVISVVSVVLLSYFFSFSTYATNLLSPLDFGLLVVAKNERESQVVVPPVNYAYSTKDIHLFKRGEPAIIEFTGLRANTQVYIRSDSQDVRLTSPFTQNYFIVKQLLFRNRNVTDAYGEIRIPVGGILATSANGKPYIDETYSGSLDIVIEY